jgi:hypothetical protein
MGDDREGVSRKPQGMSLLVDRRQVVSGINFVHNAARFFTKDLPWLMKLPQRLK